ncbi:Aste57867_8692 [Aphanomyces stellatus]|uniref:Aste57867_8692 protein n=1 Tax=Aphanomyces stellatus TaxID=120398 RepID=A0A485KL53_9STRA|nr:hypothetical protein As57867_008658 [Aphanomyces stellatus]VFT85578.1 Aste57867_8692 [Aphanomyces stellatus]
MIAPASLPWGPGVSAIPIAASKSKMDRVRVWAGLVYLVSSLSCSVWYVLLLGPSMANDLYWPHYNTTGYQVFLIDLLNIKLQTTSHDDSVDVLSVDATILKSYASSAVQPDFYNNYARRVLLSELNTLEKGIQGMRSTAPSRMASPYVQYCWVDFDRRWDIAHTDVRSQRCRQRYQNNAAVYLEFLARNVDWGEFLDANSNSWSIVIGSALAASPSGAKWLADRPTFSLVLAIDDEVAHLMALNLTRYDLQWHNEIQMGLVEQIWLQNTLNSRQPVPLKSMNHLWAPWTSINMFWNFRNDLGTLRTLNVSLIRSAPNYFQTVGGSDFFSSQLGLKDANGHYVAQTGVFYNQIGPFGSVDLLYVQVPASLAGLYAKFMQRVYEAQVHPEHLAEVQLTPFPPLFNQSGLTYYGGNLLCLKNPPTPFPQPPLAFDDACANAVRFTIVAAKKAILFSLFVTPAAQVEAICSLQESPNCIGPLAQSFTDLRTLGIDSTDVFKAVQQLRRDLPAIQFTQYAADASGMFILLQQPLLTSDPNWSFYGWLTLFDWAEGRREVLSIEGDNSTIVVMSDVALTFQMTIAAKSTVQSGPQAIYYLTVYTTCILLALGLAVLLCLARDGYRIHGQNVFMFHRVASFVWIGRPLLLLRGLTAMVVLATPRTLMTQSHHGYTSFVPTQLTMWETLLVASEALWVVFVATDMLLVFEPRGSVKYEAALATGLAWVTTVVLVMTEPLSPTVGLTRNCTTGNADEYLYCHSGIVTIGSWHRVLTFGWMNAVALVLAHGIVRFVTRGSKQATGSAPWYIHGAARAFFDVSTPGRRHAWDLDSVASVMSGSLPVKLSGRPYAFDVKMWVVHQSHRDGTMPQSGPSTRRVTFMSESKPWTWYVVLGLGVGYLGLSAVGSVSYIALSQINFANDFYWATFNMTGHHVAIADWFNLQLALDGNASAIRLDDPKYTTVDIDYANPALQVTSSPWYGARLQFEELNTLSVAIQGLRQTDGCAAPWISTQYCWLDFGRQWPMANSQARQQRCLSNVENGALYLEAVLRNIDRLEFYSCWGDAFNLAFEIELQKDDAGKQWLSNVQDAVLSVADEVSHWMTHGILHFMVQWQNYKLPGLINTYQIENAFGAQYAMTLSHSNGTFMIAAQESYKMYWTFASDLWAVNQNLTDIGGHSLIRTSASFAFANITMLNVLVQNRTLHLPMPAVYALVQNRIGPFGSIDMKNVPCPASLKALMAASLGIIRQTLSGNVSATTAYLDIAPALLGNHFALPSKFMNLSTWLAFGGHILCPEIGNTPIKLGLYQFTGRLVPCGQWSTTLLLPTKANILIAAIVSGLAHDLAKLDSVCAHDTDANLCLHGFLGPSVAFLDTFVSSNQMSTIQALAASATHKIRSIEPSLMQYVRENATQPMQMLTFTLLDPLDPTFDFWSWLHLLEWTTADREVVSFQGDAGAIHLLTEWTPPIRQQVQTSELPTTFTYYALGGAQYITAVLLGLSVLVLVYAATSRLHIEATNLFKVNRVAGIVWIGRPLLLLRSVTALCLLSTATLTLEIENHVSGFRVPRLPWYKTILGAGETTWLVYILNDVLTVWTTEYTASYAFPHSLLVWFVAAMFTLLQPVQHAVTIDRGCHIDHMDFQIVCSSGVVVIGQVTRLYCLMAIGVTGNVVVYILARLWVRTSRQDKRIQFQHLSSGARYFLNQSHWVHQGIYYIDPASAVLNGLVVVPWGDDSMHFIDVKLWRSFSTPTSSDVPPRFQRCLPLTE